MHRPSPLRLLAGLLVLAQTLPASAGRLSFVEENDTLPISQDRHYTQGFRFDWLGDSLLKGGLADRAVDGLSLALPMFGNAADGSERRLQWVPVGQSLFTPKNLKIDPPDPDDRPYAGWLYTGVGLLQQDGGHRLHHLELLAGVIGPAALAREVQDGFHQLLGLSSPNYDRQLRNRVTAQLSYDYRQRIALDGRDHAATYGSDWVPEAGISIGNVYRLASAGFSFRLGDALAASYGPLRIRPASSGTGWFDASKLSRPWQLNTFAGVQVRYTQYNAFIDRAAEVAPYGLSRRAWVADANAGAELFVSRRVEIAFSATLRSLEFRGQRGADVFGSMLLAASF